MEIQEWQKGNNSKLTSLDRAELHAIWLKEQHEQVKNSIQEKELKSEEPKIFLGFIDIDA